MAVRQVGLDIGATHVRAAEVEFSGRTGGSGKATLVRYADVPLPLGAVSDGEIHELDTVTAQLKRLWVEGKFSTKDVIAGVGNPRVVVREIEVPSLPMDQLRTSLPFQVSELLPMATDDALLDIYPTGERETETGSQLRGMMVAANKASVSTHVKVIEDAGLHPQMIDLYALALCRAHAIEEWNGHTVAFVDIGARTTNVVVVSGGVPRFVRTLPGGGQDATDAVASAMQISAEDAEQLKREVGVGFQIAENLTAAADALTTTSRSLVESIRNTFVFYSGNNPGAGIEHVVLTGGGAYLPGLDQALTNASRLPVSFGDGLARCAVPSKLRQHLKEGAEAKISMAVGLAFGEVAA